MLNARFVQAAGACALIGGSAWVVGTIIHALQPRGCVGDECLVRPQREATTATSWLVVVAVVAMVAFLVALLALMARVGDLGWTGIAGVVTVGLGLVLLALPVLPQFRGLRPLPGLVAVTVGLALVGWTVLRSRVVPTWVGIGLVLGVLSLAASGEQTWRVLFALPFGMAWLTTGVVLLLQSRTPRGAPVRTPQ